MVLQTYLINELGKGNEFPCTFNGLWCRCFSCGDVLEFLQCFRFEENSAVSIGLEVDTNVELGSTMMKELHSCRYTGYRNFQHLYLR